MVELRLESALPLNQYLVRPKRMPGEGLSAWLNRHFLMNGLPLPWRLRSQIILSYRHRREPEPRVELLERINELLPVEALVQPESWVAWCFEQQPSNAADWQSSSRQYYPHGFCPECLREWGYFLELWEIPGVSACPRHEGKLLLACPACGHDTGEWEWVDGRYQCRCGVSLEDIAAEPADRFSLAWPRKVATHSRDYAATWLFFCWPSSKSSFAAGAPTDAGNGQLEAWFSRPLGRLSAFLRLAELSKDATSPVATSGVRQ